MAHEFDHPEFEGPEESVAVLEYKPSLDIFAWEKRGEELAKKDSDVRWEIGDWILSGTEIFEDNPSDPMGALDHAEMITGLARGTLKDLASTAKRCAVSVRTDALSWSHHRILINMRPDDDEEKLKEWLELAKEKELSVLAFTKELKSPVGPRPTLKKSFNVTVPLDVWETLKDLADEERSTVQEIAAQVLIGHCEQDEVRMKRDIARKNVRKRRHDARSRAGKRVVRRNPHVLNNLRN